MMREAMVISLLLLYAMAKEKAILEVVMPTKTLDNGEYKRREETLVGHFSLAGSAASAEGPIVQVSISRYMYTVGICMFNCAVCSARDVTHAISYYCW